MDLAPGWHTPAGTDQHVAGRRDCEIGKNYFTATVRTGTSDVRVPGALQHGASFASCCSADPGPSKGGICYGPGSAAHHERARRRASKARSRASARAMGLMLRCARDTQL